MIVLSVLLMLPAIATPFLLSTRRDYQSAVRGSERFRARRRGRRARLGAVELERTHTGFEAAGGGAGTPYWDDPAELAVAVRPEAWKDLRGEGGGPLLADPRGDLWGIRVRDEQAFVNADTATPLVWGAVVGRTTLTTATTPSDGFLEVESTAGFAPGGGEIVVGYERVSYQRAEGTRFSGVTLRRNYPEGVTVTSAQAWDLAAFNFRSPRAAAEGGFATMWTPSLVKEGPAFGAPPVREEDLDRVLAPFTSHGKRRSADRWLAPTRVTAEVDPAAFNEEAGGQPVRVENPDWFNAGATVRLAVGDQVHYDLVTRVSGATVWLLNPAPGIFPFDVSTLASEVRHPVNVNAASREVLVMLLEGLEWSAQGGRGANADRRVTRDLAEEVADVLIKNRPVRGLTHLVELMKALYFVKRGEGSSYGSYQQSRDAVTEAFEETWFGGESEVPEVDPSDVFTGRDPTKSAPMTAEMAIAIVQNALNPNHRFLLASSMPFTYASGDVFTVETEASVNDAAGTELARYRQRETFRTAPAQRLRRVFTTQEDFELPIVATRRGRFVATHPRNLEFPLAPAQTPASRVLRMMSNFESPSRPGTYPSRLGGDLRALASRLETAAPGDFEEHFDGTLQGAVAAAVGPQVGTVPAQLVLPEGFPSGRLAYRMPLNGGTGSNGLVSGLYPGLGAATSGVVADALGLLPFVVEFFVRPADFGSAPTFLEMRGDDATSDHIRAWYEPGDASFHFRVHDDTIDDPSSGFEEACEVVWTPPTGIVEDDTWYHLSLHVGGCRPEAISLHVDGFKRGEAKFQSRLAGAISDDDLNFEVEDATDWPDHGTFWIGGELVVASRVSGNSYTCLDNQNPTSGGLAAGPLGRGARGTRARAHQSGEGVRLFGASVGLTNAYNEPGEVLSEGGASLASALGPFRILAISDANGNSETVPGTGPTNPGQPGPPPVVVNVIDLNSAPYLELDSFTSVGTPGTEVEAFQESGGYALLVSRLTDGTTLSTSGQCAQVFRYDRRQGRRLVGLSAVPAGLQLSSGLAGVTGTLLTTTLATKIVTQQIGGGTNMPQFRAALVPISVHLTDASGYRPAGPTTAAAAGATNVVYGEFVQIGSPARQPTASSFAAHEIEWVRYYDVDVANDMLLDTGSLGLILAIPYLQGTLTGGNPAPDPIIANQLLRFRGQLGTDQFGFDTFASSPKTHPTGEQVLPVFRMTNASDDSPSLGYGDAVTIHSPVDGQKFRRYLAWSSLPQSTNYDGTWALAALTEPAGVRIHQVDLTMQMDHRATTRLVKFPSGELPLITANGEAFIGSRGTGGATGDVMIDEIRLRGLVGREYVLWDHTAVDPLGTATSTFPIGVDVSDQTIPIVDARTWRTQSVAQPISNQPGATTYTLADGRRLEVNQVSGLGTGGGLVQIDDEIVFYRRIGTGPNGHPVLEDCERGVMNTVPTEHSFGASIVFLDWRAASRLMTPLDPEGYQVNLASAGGFSRDGGLVLIGRELVHYNDLRGGSLSIPVRFDEDGDPVGMFRGRFGTDAGTHGADEMVLDMPFRYWDRYAPMADDPTMGFWECALEEPGAFVESLEWTHRFEQARLGLRFLVRLDDRVSWAADPKKSGGRLLAFGTETGREQEKAVKKRVGASARDAAVRAFFTWEAGAFDPVDLLANDWKTTPILLDLSIGYLAPDRVLSREALR
ncbi:MAG: hypothetical protein R3F20_10300 [Planctomycetota bacterium]